MDGGVASLRHSFHLEQQARHCSLLCQGLRMDLCWKADLVWQIKKRPPRQILAGIVRMHVWKGHKCRWEGSPLRVKIQFETAALGLAPPSVVLKATAAHLFYVLPWPLRPFSELLTSIKGLGNPQIITGSCYALSEVSKECGAVCHDSNEISFFF